MFEAIEEKNGAWTVWERDGSTENLVGAAVEGEFTDDQAHAVAEALNEVYWRGYRDFQKKLKNLIG